VRRIALIGLGIFAVSVSGPAAARNDIQHIPFAGLMSWPGATARLGTTKFVFGETPASGYQVLGDYVASERSHFHGRPEVEACEANFIDALVDLKEHAERAGGNAVIGVTSFYRNVTFSSATEFECHIGSNGAFVWIRGTLGQSSVTVTQ
jgi:uncharacterized protein YbjQ (UPF0145 family)